MEVPFFVLFLFLPFFFPMGIFFPWEIRGLFPRGKLAATESRYPTVMTYQPIVCAVILCVTTPPAVGAASYSFTTDGYGIFNVRAFIFWVRAVLHEGGGHAGTNKSA